MLHLGSLWTGGQCFVFNRHKIAGDSINGGKLSGIFLDKIVRIRADRMKVFFLSSKVENGR